MAFSIAFMTSDAMNSGSGGPCMSGRFQWGEIKDFGPSCVHRNRANLDGCGDDFYRPPNITQHTII